jgi:aminopeptidase N
VIVCLKNDYAKNGCGLHRFVDPEDTQEYLYTQFEAFYAHRMFPCFDQPDLKATLQLTVVAPSDWRVISNTNVVGSDDPDFPASEGEVVTVFKQTLRISTYLYAVCAGPYAEFRIDENEVGIPLGFYCRQTLAKYMVLERYSVPTIQGFKFYNEFFDFAYPFEKYDQVFVPEFNFGAMENVGCVTYRDQFLFKDPPRGTSCCPPSTCSSIKWLTCGSATSSP